MILNISHISLSTNSLKKVENFYVKKLKFKIVHKFVNKKTKQTYGYFLKISKKNYLEFFLYKGNHKKNLNKPYRHLCFDVDNIYKTKNLFKNKRITIRRGKTDDILQFFTKDNEGNIVEFHQKDKRSKF